MAMSMDSELKKILLREQDLRFVTDALSQYLGQKAEERAVYAKERGEEIKAEKVAKAKSLEKKEYTYYDPESGKMVKDYLTADQRAALGTVPSAAPEDEKPLETEEYYFNLPPEDEWSEEMGTSLSGYHIDDNIRAKGGTYKVSLDEENLSYFTEHFSQVDKPTELKPGDYVDFVVGDEDIRVNEKLTYKSGETIRIPLSKAESYKNAGKGLLSISSSKTKGDMNDREKKWYEMYQKQRQRIANSLNIKVDALGGDPVEIYKQITESPDGKLKYEGLNPEQAYQKFLQESVFIDEKEYNDYKRYESYFKDFLKAPEVGKGSFKWVND